MDAHHFVIIECRHLAKGCILKCGCNGLMFSQSLMSGHKICYMNTIGIVPVYYAFNVCDALVASCATTG